ncbi:vitamin B12 transporter [Poseidonocella pacifica]|uniref:Vitamin B12 transporter n=1 Tax=Poseidonocella pacifica TaxID=871651 RepID=A0A1I0V4U8_9RHOB|nr:TonB-dependent receptor [Poseidonocella pacifica]SFA71113.1 vitamin B12 transporter [Poseidonocella pacifica]
MTKSAYLRRGISAAALLVGTTASAQEVYDLGTILVRGGLSPVEAGTYGRSASVVTSDEIEARGYQTVYDALRAVPGLSVSTGGLSELRIRGGEANQSVVLIDGVEVAKDSFGGYDLSLLDLADVERIEVLRGPQSAIHGADAATGVISITTRAGGDASRTTAMVEVGSNESRQVALNTSRVTDRGRVALSFANRTTAGYDISDDKKGNNDAQSRRSLQFSAEGELIPGVRVGLVARDVASSSEFDRTTYPFGAGSAKEDYVIDGDELREDEETSTSLYAITEGADGRFRGELRFNNAYLEQAFPYYSSFSKMGRAQAQAKVAVGLDGALDGADHILTVLAEREREDYSTSGGISRARQTDSVAAEYQGHILDAVALQLGLRQDWNEDFGDATSWNAGLSYELPNRSTRLHLSAGKGTVNPTWYELYGFSGSFRGNSDLEPEVVQSWDIGFEQRIGDTAVLDLTYFEQTVTDRIVTVTSGGGGTTSNVKGDSESRGAEVTLALRPVDMVKVDLAYTWLDARDPDDNRQIRRPEHTLSLNAAVDLFDGRGQAVLGVRHVSGLLGTDQSQSATTKLDDFTVVDLGASYEVRDGLVLTGRVENLFDTEYEEQWGYTAERRSAYVGLRASF